MIVMNDIGAIRFFAICILMFKWVLQNINFEDALSYIYQVN